MNQTGAGALGILQLQNKPTMFPGSLAHPGTFAFPTISRAVPGAWVSNVVAGDPAVEDAFVSAARDLVDAGAIAITTNCGFALRHQRAIAHAVAVPVATSSLLLLPFLTATTAGRIGVLTFDSRPLTRDMLRIAGMPDDANVSIAGLEGTATWEIMSRPDAPITPQQMEDDVLVAIQSLRDGAGELSLLLFECAGFPVVSKRVRKMTGLPVYDVVDMANLLMSSRRPSSI